MISLTTVNMTRPRQVCLIGGLGNYRLIPLSNRLAYIKPNSRFTVHKVTLAGTHDDFDSIAIIDDVKSPDNQNKNKKQYASYAFSSNSDAFPLRQKAMNLNWYLLIRTDVFMDIDSTDSRTAHISLDATEMSCVVLTSTCRHHVVYHFLLSLRLQLSFFLHERFVSG
jgi:hypothetical protein